MTGSCPHSIYGAPCDPIFDFAARRVTCRRCGGPVTVDWLPGRWRGHRVSSRATFWIPADPEVPRRVILEDLGASQSGTRTWVVLQDEQGGWQVLEETREIPAEEFPAWRDASPGGA